MRLLCAAVVALLLAATGAIPAGAQPADSPRAGAAAAQKKRHKPKRKACSQRHKHKAAHQSAKRKARKCKRRKARPPAPPPRIEGGADDAVVVAVIDSAVNPYHWDFLAAKMPQQSDAVAGNELPLDRPATDWLPGFPAAERLDLKLQPANPGAQLGAPPEHPWDQVKTSSAAEQHVYWLPGTKVIGAMTWASGEKIAGESTQHGVGTTSSAVGNMHGTCPECLLFFIQYGGEGDGEAAIAWAMRQPWIDVVSNSYGFGFYGRERIWAGSDTALQRSASERGQSIFFSAGNGVDGGFTVPNTTDFSSQEGPDWIITVGAISPGESNYYGSGNTGGSYVGAGKPADVAGVGQDYPTAYTATTVAGTGEFGFGGTSNATPEVAGLYARALYEARTALHGPSRTQAGGVVATGEPYSCGGARSACELADGRLTAAELRTRLFHAAIHTDNGFAIANPAASDPTPTVPPVGEEEFLDEGHGSYFGRQAGPKSNAWLKEFDRILDPLLGRAAPLQRPAGELEWMVVDSYCRQHNWGAWKLGYFLDGVTQLPGPDPAYPVRSFIEQTCPGGPTPLG